MKIEATLTGFDEVVDALVAAVREGAADGVAEAAELVATEARAHHSFHNRTGDLEASIHVEDHPHDHPDAPSAFVVASEDYAQYVDAKLPFLEPAFDAVEGQATAAVERAIDRALAKNR